MASTWEARSMSRKEVIAPRVPARDGAAASWGRQGSGGGKGSWSRAAARRAENSRSSEAMICSSCRSWGLRRGEAGGLEAREMGGKSEL